MTAGVFKLILVIAGNEIGRFHRGIEGVQSRVTWVLNLTKTLFDHFHNKNVSTNRRTSGSLSWGVYAAFKILYRSMSLK
jgi:hypothetical protein